MKNLLQKKGKTKINVSLYTADIHSETGLKVLFKVNWSIKMASLFICIGEIIEAMCHVCWVQINYNW